MASVTPAMHAAQPNSETTQRVSAGSVADQTTAPEAQRGDGPVIGGFPDASQETKVVSEDGT